MLKLSLVAKQGNGVRYFPHAGYLRLTPLKIEGIVRTRIDEDNKPLLCSGLYVALRCYEARLGLGLGLGGAGSAGASCVDNAPAIGNGNPNVLYEIAVPLWTPESASEYEPLGNGEWPFKIVLPPNASPVCSTVHFQEYRVFWRVEAVLTHVPITGVGMRLVRVQEVPLLRYDARQDLPQQPPNKWRRVALPSRSSRSLPSTLKYIINNPPFPFAPLDHVPVTIKLALPPGIDVTSVALSVERRLAFKSTNSSTSSVRNDAYNACMESASTFQPHLPFQSSSKTATTTAIASTTVPVTSLHRARQTGHMSRTVTTTLQIPQAKSLSHWSLGETIHTPLASVRFFLKCKLTLTDSPTTEDTIPYSSFPSPSPSHPQLSMPSAPSNSQSTSHSYSIDLQEKELYIIATNEADRHEAISKYRDAVKRGRKRRVNALGKEKETAALPVTELGSTSTAPTHLTSECDFPARGRSSSQSASRSRLKSRFLKGEDPSDSTERANHQGKAKGKEKSEGNAIDEIASEELALKRNPDSKKKKVDTVNRMHRLSFRFLAPRSRRFFRQGLASDGDGNIDIDSEGRVYDGEYVLVDNVSPLSVPRGWRRSANRLAVPPSSYPSSPISPETSADECNRRVVYLFDKGRSSDHGTGTNVSTGTTATTTSEGTEEISGPPTPPDDVSLDPQVVQTHHFDLPSVDCGELASPASMSSPRLWTTYVPSPVSASSLRPPIPIPTPRSTSTTTSASFSWDEQRTEEGYESRVKEEWEMELKKSIAGGLKTESVMNSVSVKAAKNSSTITGIRFRRRKSRRVNPNTTPNGTQMTCLSPVSCCESDTCPSSFGLSPPSPVYIPFSPSTPVLPIDHTSTPMSPPSPGPLIAKSKSSSKSKVKALGFGINWGFGRGQGNMTV